MMVGEKGTTAATAMAAMAPSGGARLNSPASAFSGTMSSFCSNLSTSATGCSKPKGPTIVGPSRLCMRAAILRSNHKAMAVVLIKILMMTEP